MNCNSCKKLLPLLIDGGLSEPEKNEVQIHIDICDNCLTEFKELNEHEFIIKKSSSRKPPTIIWEKIKNNLPNEHKKKKIPIFQILIITVLVIFTAFFYYIIKNYSISIRKKPNPAITTKNLNLIPEKP